MVNWNSVLSGVRHQDLTVDFVENAIGLRDFHRSLNGTAKKEINKVRTRGASGVRTLARKALRRRNIRYTLVG